MPIRSLRTSVLLLFISAIATAQNPPAASVGPQETVRAIPSPAKPLPSEAASAGMTKFSFIAYGDTRGLLDGEEIQYEHLLAARSMLRTAAAMANGPDPIRFIVWTGDAVADGTVANQWNASFVDVVSVLTEQGGLPFFPAPGNHDIAHTSSLDAPGRLAGLRNYYSAFRNLIPAEGSPRRLAGYPTFAIAYGNTFVLLWDSSIADDPTQFNWIKSQLETLDRRRYVNIVAVAHHPAFSSGYHGGAVIEHQTQVIRDQFMPLFRQHHVRLMFAGHEHLLDHWVERYQGTDGKPYRLDQIVSGGGGAPLYAYQGEPDLRAYLQASAASNVRLEHLVKPGMTPGENPYHYIVVHVDGDRIRVEVVGVGFGQNFQPYRSRTVDLTIAPPTP